MHSVKKINPKILRLQIYLTSCWNKYINFLHQYHTRIMNNERDLSSYLWRARDTDDNNLKVSKLKVRQPCRSRDVCAQSSNPSDSNSHMTDCKTEQNEADDPDDRYQNGYCDGKLQPNYPLRSARGALKPGESRPEIDSYTAGEAEKGSGALIDSLAQHTELAILDLSWFKWHWSSHRRKGL